MSYFVDLCLRLLQLVAQHILILLLVTCHILNSFQSLVTRLLVVVIVLVELSAGCHVPIHSIEVCPLVIGIQLPPSILREYPPINDEVSSILGQLVIPVLLFDKLAILYESLGLPHIQSILILLIHGQLAARTIAL